MRSPLSQAQLDHLLVGVDKPARYTGGELNAVVKEGPLQARLALAFADLYEVAESHIGLKILYDIVNASPHFAAERVYAPAPDLEAKLRAAKLPLWSLETRRPLAAFDVVGFTLQYELSWATMLAMLELGGITLRSAARREDEPLVIGGGAGAFNPEPIAPFFDAFLLGDGEEAVGDILAVVASGRARGASRAELLRELAHVGGIYIPSHFEVTYDGLALAAIRPKPGAPVPGGLAKHGSPRVTRRVIADLDKAAYPTRQIVPNVRPVHERVAVEIQRGCSQACRFCQAGMITRPTRQRRPETVLKLADQALAATGADEVGLLSLSAGDYAPINQVLSEFFKRYKEERVAIGMPSMRTETMTAELAEQVATVRKSGWTFAPEAGSERLRAVINKTNSEEDLLNAVRATVRAGWRQLKFYFMIGLPTETDADIDAIALLAERARAEGRKIRRDVNVVVSVSTFVPKPHTAFQWERQIGIDETEQKHARLRQRLRQSKITFRYHGPEQSFLEGVLSRGDRRLADAIEKAARGGCRLDAWSEHYDHDSWMLALHEGLLPHGLAPADYLEERSATALLAWDHLDAGILKKFLLRERKRAYQAASIDDCALTDHCYACGGCHLADPYLPKGNDGRREVALRPIVHQSLEQPPQLPARRGTPVTASVVTTRSRLRFRYAKGGRALHLSQLETSDQILRAIRQAQLPVLYSEGYTPRPKVSFSPACPSGIESRAEYFEIACAGTPAGRTCAEALGRFLPDGINVLDVHELAWDAPTLAQTIGAMHYSAALPAAADLEEVREQLASFFARPAVPVMVLRKGRSRLHDARAQVLEAAVVGYALQLSLRASGDGGLKLQEALVALLGAGGAQIPLSSIRKERVSLLKHSAPSPRELPGGEVPLDLRAQSERLRARPKARHCASGVVPYAE